MITQIIKEVIRDTWFRFFFPYALNIQGFKMFIDPKAPYVMRKTFRAYAKYKVHEPATTQLFRKIVKKGDVVVDIGANLGYFSLLSASLGAERVYAFEPEEVNWVYLNRNIKLNGFSSDIIVSSFALSNKEGIANLYLCGYDSGHHTINQDKGIKDYRKTSLMRKCLDIFISKQRSIKIRTMKLDDLALNYRPTIIKMDCEGAEALALEGMDMILTKNQNIKMVVEFFPLLLESMGSSPKNFINQLKERYKFRIFIIPDDYSAINIDNVSNVVVVKDSPATAVALGSAMIEVNGYNELMKHCPGKEDHLNLYLKRK